MNTGVTHSGGTTGTGYKGGSCDNIISFAGYVARRGRKSSYRHAAEESNLVRLAGCDVIDLADKR